MKRAETLARAMRAIWQPARAAEHDPAQDAAPITRDELQSLFSRELELAAPSRAEAP